MTVRAYGHIPDRPLPDVEDWHDRDAEIESRASDLELRMPDQEWIDLLLDSLDTYHWPIRHQKFGPDGFIDDYYQSDMDKIRETRLRALRTAVQCHQYEVIGRAAVAAFRGALIAKVEEEL